MQEFRGEWPNGLKHFDRIGKFLKTESQLVYSFSLLT